MRAILFLYLAALGAAAQGLRYHTMPDDVVEGRLERLGKDNPARSEMLWTLFTEAGCLEPNLVREKVKGSKLPNIVCSLPSGDVDEWIVVSAHYDRARSGAGALDNWTGASLLPSLYQSLRSTPERKYGYLFIGFSHYCPAISRTDSAG